ncbi:MAG: tetratricopeptide repeat protein [Elainellaceae cyanobacterium]
MHLSEQSQYAAAATVEDATDSSAIAVEGLVQEGKAFYDVQDYVQANQRLERAVQAYAEGGDRLHQAQTLALQSLVLQKLGNWDTAQTLLDQSFALLRALTDPPRRIRAQVLNAQGQLYFATGQTQPAFQSWDGAEADYSAAGETLGDWQPN